MHTPITKKTAGSLMTSAATIASLAFALCGPTAALAASPLAVNLGTAGSFVVLSKTGVSTTGATFVVGDLGVSPAAATYVTGFALTLPTAGAFSTSATIDGKVYAPDYANPTPTKLTTAILDMQAAYTDAAGRAPTVTELGAGNVGGLELPPGVYKWSTGVSIPTNVTLVGSERDVWIFQVAQNLTVSSGAQIILSGGARAANIFWQVAGKATIDTTAIFNGNILGQTAITLNTGAKLNGRALAQTAVTLDSNTVTIPPVATITFISVPTPESSSTSVATNSNETLSSLRVILGNGQLVHVDTSGNFLNESGSFVSNSSVAAAVTATPPPSAFSQQIRAIATDLRQGSVGSDVRAIQQFLVTQNKGVAAQSLATVGATSYFGKLTRAALAEFQANVGIRPSLGNFGPVTRQYLSTAH